MKKLTARLLLFLFLFGSTVVGVYLYNPIDAEKNKKNDFLLVLKDKEKRLFQRKQPCMLFAGGSGAAFSIDAEAIGKKMNRCGFNLGVHAGLGIIFMVNQVMKLAKPGDVIVVSTEYYLSEAEIPLKASVIQSMPDLAPYFEIDGTQIIALRFEMFSKWFYDRARRIQATVGEGKMSVLRKDNNQYYRKNGFSPYGDYVLHLNQARPWGIFTTYDYEKKDYSTEIACLNKLKSLENKGVKVYYAFPAYVDTDFEKNQIALRDFEKQLRKGLLFPILGRPDDFLYPDSLFFDTAYHLGKTGREKRAETMDRLLKEAALTKP
jgi:hypothetical protein